MRAPFLPRASPVPRVLLSAAALFLAALLSACGSDDGRGHAALGAAGPADDRSPTGPVPPHDGITLTPLDGDGAPATGNGSPPYAFPSPTDSGTPTAPGPGATPPTAPQAQDTQQALAPAQDAERDAVPAHSRPHAPPRPISQAD
ncbi:hypothetical protein ACEWKJ_25405, partial [Streptomyces chrestomyceticus]